MHSLSGWLRERPRFYGMPVDVRSLLLRNIQLPHHCCIFHHNCDWQWRCTTQPVTDQSTVTTGPPSAHLASCIIVQEQNHEASDFRRHFRAALFRRPLITSNRALKSSLPCAFVCFSNGFTVFKDDSWA